MGAVNDDGFSVRLDGEGFAMVYDWLIYHPDVTGEALRTYLVLVRCANYDDHTTFVTVPTIADRMGKSHDSITRNLKLLERVGAVAVDRTPNRDGKPSTYTVATSRPLDAEVRRDPHADVRQPPRRSAVKPPRRSAGAPIPRPITTDTQLTKGVEQRDDEGLFDRFYARYPRRVGKPAARRAWSAAMKKGTEVDAIRTGLQAWMTYWRDAATPEHLIPHPSTWLNQERWNDTPPAIVAAKPTGRPGALGTQGEWDMALAKYGTVDADHPADTRELNR